MQANVIKKFTALLVLALAGAGLFYLPSANATEPEIYYVPDVINQFGALSVRADALGFSIGISPDPSASKHYQGIVRSHGRGTPYFFVSRSETSGPCEGSQPGNLLTVRMASRDRHGERLRSNRIRKDKDTDDTPPPASDVNVGTVTFNGTNGWPHYGHPGGMDRVGDVLVVPLERPCGGQEPEGKILFIDVSNPEAFIPVPDPPFCPPFCGNPDSSLILSEFDNVPFTPGLVSVTPQANGRYLMLMTGGNNVRLMIYESMPTEEDGSTDLRSPDLDWIEKDLWFHVEDEVDLGTTGFCDLAVDLRQFCGFDWPSFGAFAGCILEGKCNHPHQTLHFLREGGIDGDLYLVGIRNPGGGAGTGAQDTDLIDLYRVEWEGTSEEPEFKLRWVMTRHLVAKPTKGGTDLANFAAASAIYVSPSGELLLYATEHDNDGPKDSRGVGTVKAGEWRHHDMVRRGSPTYNPTPVTEDPFEVDEGADITLQGQADPPITRAWVELYEDDGFTNESIVIDYEDWGLDDFDDFGVFGFSDDASSWRWFAPIGCTIRVNDDDFSDGNFPGKFTRTLEGVGEVRAAPDLWFVRNDDGASNMNDELTSAQFFADCDTYYHTPTDYELSWDLDRDGFFETFEETPVYSAAGLDGPDVIMLPIKATHLPDALSGTSAAQINVVNVAPVIESLSITDSAGRELGVDVLTAPAGRQVRLEALFTDPGIPDTQTATIDWGDGTLEPSTSFDQFSDANGGVTGRARHSHIYTNAGIYDVILVVEDDDGGQNQSTRQIEIVAAGGGGGGIGCTISRTSGIDPLFPLVVLFASASLFRIRRQYALSNGIRND
ncbi:MAG: PKD domain-containing protein [Gammaproteobacteria bacterium]|nr:PKD domain-containing protein [Gammaproteobacteria bacterium]